MENYFPKEFFDEMVDAIADPIYVKDEDQNWIYLNKPALAFLGETSADKIGKNEFDFFDRQTAWEIHNHDRSVFKNGTPERLDLQMVFNGRIYYFAFHSSLFHFKGNTFLVGTIREITEQKKAEERWHATARRLQLLADHTQIGIITCDIEMRVTYLNQIVLNYSGMGDVEATAVDLTKLLTPLEPLEQFLNRQKENTGSRVVEQWQGEIHHSSNLRLPVKIFVTPIFDQGEFKEVLIILEENK